MAMWGRSGFINTASAVVALVLVAVGAVQPPAVADNVDFVFPDAQEMREMSGWRVNSPYENPHLLYNQRILRHTKCAPRFALSALQASGMEYPMTVRGRRYSEFVSMAVYRYRNADSAKRAVNKYRKQMSGCHRWKLRFKNPKYPPAPFFTFTTGVSGGPGKARMRHRTRGFSPTSARREWLTARDKYVVAVTVDNSSTFGAFYPPKKLQRRLTRYAVICCPGAVGGHRLSLVSGEIGGHGLPVGVLL